jgi:MoxR-like ATPase
MSATITADAVRRIHAVETELNEYLVGRDAEIHGSLLALVARSHVFLLSAPGAGKSYLASEVCRRVSGAAFFRIDLHAFTLRDEIFGPVSLRAMRERDALERKYVGYLPDAHVAQLDEIWKCPPSTLNTMLTLLNEREFRNDDQTLRAPLLSAIVTSNELPPADRSLDAMYDRILLRYAVAPLGDAALRKQASSFSVRMKAFESAARTAWVEIVDAQRREQGDAFLPSPAWPARPDRWLIDAWGPLFSDADLLAATTPDGTVALPPDEALAKLVLRMAAYAREAGLVLPYRTFLSLGDLAELHSLALLATMPDSVDEVFYRIIESTPGVSVRREAELRILLGAEAVLAGRTQVALEDLRILAHALWNRPEERLEIARTVERETGYLESELAAAEQTIADWRRAIADGSGAVANRLAMREQMRRDLARLEALAEAHPGNDRLAAVVADGREVRDDYEARLFSGEDKAAS